MVEADPAAPRTMPEFYDRHLGPVLFGPYAVELTRRLSTTPEGPVLETACGTGILTRRLRARLSGGTRFVATDVSGSMLAYARRQHHGVPGIEWLAADAAALPFASGTFALIVCQFGLVPFGFHDRTALRELLAIAGFRRLQIEPVTLDAASRTAESFAMGLVHCHPAVKSLEERGGSATPIVAAVAAALTRLGGNRPFRSTMQALVVTARTGA
jgi:SAM-dependent methyltransferase